MKFEIVYHSNATDNEYRDIVECCDIHEAAKWAKDHVKKDEYYFIDELPECALSPFELMQRFYAAVDDLQAHKAPEPNELQDFRAAIDDLSEVVDEFAEIMENVTARLLKVMEG